MAKYNVLQPIRHGVADGKAVKVNEYAIDDTIELSDKEAKELLAIGVIAEQKSKKDKAE